MPNHDSARFRNIVRFVSRDGENQLFINGRDVSEEVSAEGLKVTFDPDTRRPVLHVRYVLDQFVLDADAAAIEDAE